jgi:hypothetical protein
MSHNVLTAAAAVADSKALLRAIQAQIDSTQRQLAATRVLLDNCRQLLARLEAGEPDDDPES